MATVASGSRASQLVTDLIDSIDTYLYQSVLRLLHYRKYTITAWKIYRSRGPPTDTDGGLEVHQMCQLMFRNTFPYDIIHVTGTNGKGSVCTKLNNVFIRCQKQTNPESKKQIGLLTSPHINCVRERITINNTMISKYDFFAGIDYILSFEKQLNIVLVGSEIHTLLAFWYFDLKRVDLAVLECNIGGKWDASNVISKPLVSVITSISMDHEKGLGNTIEKIAKHKCGIIKPETPVVIGPNVDHQFVQNYITERALNAELFQLTEQQCADCDTYDDINIALVKLVLSVLRKCYPQKMEHIFMSEHQQQMQQALKTKQRGRLELHKIRYFELMRKYRSVYNGCTDEQQTNGADDNCEIWLMLDASHNPHGLHMFFQSMDRQYPREKGFVYHVIYGCKSGRNHVPACLKEIDGKARYLYFFSAEHLMPTAVLKAKYKFASKYTEILDAHQGDLELAVLHALDRCYRNNYLQTDATKEGKQHIILCIGTMRSHATINKMIGVLDTYD